LREKRFFSGKKVRGANDSCQDASVGRLSSSPAPLNRPSRLPKPATILTNAEALIAVQQMNQIIRQSGSLRPHFKLQSSDWICNEVRNYLQAAECAKQTPEHVANFRNRLSSVITKPFTLYEEVILPKISFLNAFLQERAGSVRESSPSDSGRNPLHGRGLRRAVY
jgi:hypothetical protein